MEFIKATHVDFMKVRRIAYVISLVILVCGVTSLAVRGLNYGVDFAGGTLLQFRFARAVEPQEVRVVLDTLNLSKSIIQRFSEDEVVVRTLKMSKEMQDQLLQALREQFGTVTLTRIEDVGPAVGAELRRMGIIALLSAIAGILIYVAFRFELEPAATAVFALIHDGLVVLGMVSILGKEFTIPILAAVLTILGYSINDSIVIMDRIRENLVSRKKGEGFLQIVNRSLNETLSRTVNTALTTALPIIALLLFGGKMLQDFSLAILVGLVAGTYSSIFIVSALWVDLERRTRIRG
ncbi:MAG: protein translocase subunit SecF [Atribacterota bacterium]